MAVDWSVPGRDEEFLRLRTGKHRRPVAEVALHFGTTVGAIYAHARVLNATVHSHVVWKAEDVARLVAFDESGRSVTEIAREMNCNVERIRAKLTDLGRGGKRCRPWSQDLPKLLDLARAEPVLDEAAIQRLAATIVRSAAMVEEKLRKAGLIARRHALRSRRPKLTVKRPCGRPRKIITVPPKAPAVPKPPPVVAAEIIEAARQAVSVTPRRALGPIAAAAGLSLQRLRQAAAAVGVDLPVGHSRRPAPDRIDRIRALAAQGLTVTAAAKVLRSDMRNVKRVAAEAGIVFAQADRSEQGRRGAAALHAGKVRVVKPAPVEPKVKEVKRKTVAVAKAPKPVAPVAAKPPKAVRAAAVLPLARRVVETVRPAVVPADAKAAAARFMAWRAAQARR